MSYILDALRKAEKDRNLGRTPSLGDVTSPPVRAPVSSGPSRRVLALIALVLGMLVLAILLWPSAPEVAAPPAVAVAASTPAPAASPPAPPSLPQASDESAFARNLPEDNPADPTLGADVAAESIDDLMDDPGVDVSADPTEAPLDEAEAASPKPKPPSAPRATAAAVEPAPQPAVVDEAPVPAPGSVTVEGIPLLRDMPSDYRGAFPELRVDVHVYDDDPARRWTLVNGKKAVEGSTLAEGPTVSEIRPDGIVFEFRGRTSLFPLGH